MYRFHGDATEENGDMETPLGRSYHHSTMSAISANNSASSSKAVLAALRALQEKIRRLETERAQAFDEATQLRHAIKNQEIEAEHSKQRDNLATQKSLQDAKSMYEKVQSEKTDLEIRLSKLEDKNRTDNRLLEELKLRIRGLEEEKYNGQSRIKDLEDERSQLQFEIQQSTQKEKGTASR
jgi:chromosome segregation ATPase